MLNVINGNKEGFFDTNTIYIGRANKYYGLRESPLSNKFRTNLSYNLTDVLQLYKSWLYTNFIKGEGEVYEEIMRLITLVKEGKEINIACWCKPKQCHGDIIKEFVDYIIENTNE